MKAPKFLFAFLTGVGMLSIEAEQAYARGGGGGFAGSDPSSFTVDLYQDGSDVVATGSGDINVDVLTYDSSNSTGQTGVLNPSEGFIAFGNTSTADIYDVTISGPSDYGVGTVNEYASSVSGDFVGLVTSEGNIEVPEGYVSDTPLSDSATWNNTTLANLGVTPGTYTWTWDGGLDSFTLDAGVTPVPEPADYGWGILLAALGFVAWRRFSLRPVFGK
jgi:hypothetical protein